MSALGAWRYLRLAWSAAAYRDRAALLVCLVFSGLAVASLLRSSGMDALNKAIWLVAFAIIAWGQLGSIVDRAIQEAITAEFLSRARGGMPPLSPVVTEFAGMEHVYVAGHGWRKRVHD